MRPACKQHVREFVKGGRADLANHSLDEGLCLKDTRNRPSGNPNCELFPQGPIIPIPPSSSPYRPAGVCGIIRPFPQVGMQKESPRTRGFGGRYSRYFAGGFALWRRRNSIRRHSAVLKREIHPIPQNRQSRRMSRLGGHSDRDHGAISRQPLGTPTLSKPMSRKSSNRLSSSPLHGSAASPILASRW